MTARKSLAYLYQKLPHQPGVYLFRDDLDQVIYVGKAVDLKRRVASYFKGSALKLGLKTAQMVNSTATLSHQVTESELEALLLEAELIKHYRPKYNIDLKDSQRSQYLLVTKEKFPLLKKTRQPPSNDQEGELYGPFPSGRPVALVYRQLQKIFRFRSCSQTKFVRYQGLNRACLLYDLNLCSAPCTGKISYTNYQKTIKNLQALLNGQKTELVQSLTKQMKSASQKKNFEQAAYWRDQLHNLNYVTQAFKLPKQYLDNPNLVEDAALEKVSSLINLLKTYFPNLRNHEGHRLEAYDISNLFGQKATASMVVFIDGQPARHLYRRFKIKLPGRPNDVAMLQEAFSRRFGQKKDHSTKDASFSQRPDLVLVDGGKPQVSGVLKVWEKEKINYPLVGLAKSEETIIIPTNGTYITIRLAADNPARLLLQAIRDEAHRFALSYHHQLENKGFFRQPRP